MENSTPTVPPVPTSKPYPIVAIGASAGGIEALLELLAHLPANTGMTFVYVQHTKEERDSALVSILSRATAMPVVEAEDDMPMKANHLYVSPGGVLTVSNVTLRLRARTPEDHPFLPINRLFLSLSEHTRIPLVGIVLSGSATDGALGLKALKAAGGLTFAQGDTASFQSMPQGAIAEGAVDLVLSPREIAEELARIAEQKETFYNAIQDLSEESIHNRDQHLLAILHLLHRSVGVDFRFYKMNTIKRRIIRRMMLHKIATLEDYAQFLRQHTAETNLLYQDLLINVTTFFRDAESMEFLREHVLPEVLKGKSDNDPLRIWVPACSTGQEAYSLAMLVMEAFGDRAGTTPVQIFATDISETVINKARLGIFGPDDIAEIEPRRLQRFFTRVEGSYRVIKSIRDLCVFATHNVTKDPPFSRIDIVSCCNLLIYLDNVLQRKVMATFHYALNNQGYLVLGRSETVGSATNLFSPLDKKLKVYAKKKDGSAKALFEMSFAVPELQRPLAAEEPRAARKAGRHDLDVERAMDEVLLQRFIPASVLVNSDLDILQFRGATGLFLEPAPGRASLNLLKMARPGLGFELRNIVHKAKSTGGPVRKEGVELTHQGENRKVSIEAAPVRANGEDEYYLVVFSEAITPADQPTGEQDDARERQLERELRALREDMRAIVEAQEAANEELQSANEEIVSSNEELQSINEELETSKEELESSNEELITINQELQLRNEQLAESYEYAEAVFNTIGENLLVLDSNLRVKAANGAFLRTFKCKIHDVELRPLFELGHHQWNIPQLRSFLYDTVLKQDVPARLELTHLFTGLGEKVLLLNACRVMRKSHNEEIILLAMDDITEHRSAARMLAEREEWIRNMANNAPVMMWMSGTDRLNTFVNRAYIEFRGITLEDAVGRMWTEHIHPDDIERCERTYNTHFDQKLPYSVEYRLLRHDGVYRYIVDKATPNFTPDGMFTGFVGTCVDVEEYREKK
ncbi:MAG: PAS domain S-box protein [Chitinophagaceae bacterium]|nr:MAG: PAS domain S-box protein [Chitinophagaceae bacterium]